MLILLLTIVKHSLVTLLRVAHKDIKTCICRFGIVGRHNFLDLMSSTNNVLKLPNFVMVVLSIPS